MLETLKILSSALTEPSFRNMLVVAAGWLLTRGRHAVTESLVQTRVSGVRSHEIFHRFFSRASWSIDEMGKLVFLATRPLRGETPRIVVDDTVARGKGPHVFGLGCHLDASRSTRRFKVLCFGHCWVMLTVNVTLPFSSRIWSLPLLFRLYRNESICKKNSVDYKTKNELAIELRQVFLSWLPKDQRVEMLGDSAYACRALLKKKPKNLVFIGAAISTARFRRLPPKQHKRSKGTALPVWTSFSETRPHGQCQSRLGDRGTTAIRRNTHCHLPELRRVLAHGVRHAADQDSPCEVHDGPPDFPRLLLDGHRDDGRADPHRVLPKMVHRSVFSRSQTAPWIR